MQKIKKIWFDDEKLYAETANHKVLSASLNRFPRLQNATDAQRNEWYQLCDGLRWETIDEDIHLNSFLSTGNEKNIVRF